MDEHGGAAGVVVRLCGQSPKVPPVAGRDERQDGDHRVLGGVQGSGQVGGADAEHRLGSALELEPGGTGGQGARGHRQLGVTDELQAWQAQKVVVRDPSRHVGGAEAPGEQPVGTGPTRLHASDRDAGVGGGARAQRGAHLLDDGDPLVSGADGGDQGRSTRRARQARASRSASASRNVRAFCFASASRNVRAAGGALRRDAPDARAPLVGASGQRSCWRLPPVHWQRPERRPPPAARTRGPGHGGQRQHAVGAPLVDVDGVGEDVRVRRRLVDRADDHARWVDDLNVAPSSAQVGEVAGPLGARGVPEPPGRPAPQEPVALQGTGDVGQAGAEVRGIGLGQGRLGGSCAQVRGQHPRVRGVDDCGLDLGEDVLGVAHQVGVERVLRGDEHRHARPTGPPRAADLLPQGGARAGPPGGDCGVEAGDVEPELQGGCGGQRAHPPAADGGLQGAALLGQVPAPVCADPPGQGGAPRGEPVADLRCHGLGAGPGADEGEKPSALFDEARSEPGGLRARRAPDHRGPEDAVAVGEGPRGGGTRIRPVVDEAALPQGQVVRPGGGAVARDGGGGAPRHGRAHQGGVAHRRGEHDDARVRAQTVAGAQQAPDHQGDVGAGDAPPVVELVDDDVAQAGQHPRPPAVRGQYHVVQVVGVGEQRVGVGARPLLRLAGGVAVARGGVGQARTALHEGLQRGGLVRGQGLGGGQVDGGGAPVDGGDPGRGSHARQVGQEGGPRGQGFARARSRRHDHVGARGRGVHGLALVRPGALDAPARPCPADQGVDPFGPVGGALGAPGQFHQADEAVVTGAQGAQQPDQRLRVGAVGRGPVSRRHWSRRGRTSPGSSPPPPSCTGSRRRRWRSPSRRRRAAAPRSTRPSCRL